jgi:hypothetical protein
VLSHLGPLAAALCLVGGCWLGEPAIPATDPCVAGGEPGKSYSATLDEDYAAGISDVRFESGFTLGPSTCGCPSAGAQWTAGRIWRGRCVQLTSAAGGAATVAAA